MKKYVRSSQPIMTDGDTSASDIFDKLDPIFREYYDVDFNGEGFDLDGYEEKYVCDLVAKDEYSEQLSDGGIDLLFVYEGHDSYYACIVIGDRMYPVEHDEVAAAFESEDYDDEELQTESSADYERIMSKQVEDSDGFYTDYTMYKTPEGGYIFIFGDNDVYTPDNTEPDWECDTYEEAIEWFESYEGFADEVE